MIEIPVAFCIVPKCLSLNFLGVDGIIIAPRFLPVAPFVAKLMLAVHVSVEETMFDKTRVVLSIILFLHNQKDKVI